MQEVERLHNELDRTRHELEAKEHQITSLLKETSSQLDVVHLVWEGVSCDLPEICSGLCVYVAGS